MIWLVNMPISCEGVLDWEYGFICCLVSLQPTAIVKYIPPIFSIDAEEFCRCLLSFLVVEIVAGVFCVTVIFEVCMSFYVFREIVELSPMDMSWDYKVSNNVDSCQNVCLVI